MDGTSTADVVSELMRDTVEERLPRPRATPPTPAGSDAASWHALINRAGRIADAAHNSPDTTQDDRYPRALLDALHSAGLLAAPLPAACGGAALGLAAGSRHALLHVLREVGRADLSAGRLFEGHVDALLTIVQFGTTAQMRRVARQVHRGDLFGVWNTGPQTGGVTVTPTNGAATINGRKTFASGAGYLGGALVTGAMQGGGWQMCILPMIVLSRAGAVRIDASSWHPMGMQGSVSYTIDFTNVSLPARVLLGQPGDYYRQPRFTGGVLRFAAVQLGGAERLVDATRAFLRATGRADDPYQLARVGEMVTLVTGGVARLAAAASIAEVYAASEAANADASCDALLAYANITRTDIAEICLRVCELVERSVGARGLLAPYSFGDVIRDLRMYLRQPAPDAALADIGKYALSQDERIGVLWGAPGQ